MFNFKGVDISAIQGNVDMVWLKNQGYAFVVCRCYVGNDYKDANYNVNIAAAKNAGLYTMAYHFPYPLPTDPAHPGRDPISQSEMHFQAANGELAAIDLEWPPINNWGQWGCSASQIQDWTLQYLEHYEQLSGQKMLFYTYPSFAQSINFSSTFTQYKLWIASYTNSPVIPLPWNETYMWQNSGGNSLKLPNGVPVDTDLVQDLSIWGITNQVVATSTTPVIETTPLQPIIETQPIQVPITAPSTSPPIVNTISSILNNNIIQAIIENIVKIVKTLFHIQ